MIVLSLSALLVTNLCCALVWLGLYLCRRRRGAAASVEGLHGDVAGDGGDGPHGAGPQEGLEDPPAEEGAEQLLVDLDLGSLPGRAEDADRPPPRRRRPPLSRSFVRAAAGGRDGLAVAAEVASTYVFSRGRRLRRAWELSATGPENRTPAGEKKKEAKAAAAAGTDMEMMTFRGLLALETAEDQRQQEADQPQQAGPEQPQPGPGAEEPPGAAPGEDLGAAAVRRNSYQPVESFPLLVLTPVRK